jgi:hypothetical protein
VPEGYVMLEEAAAFEGIKYNTLIQRMKRSPGSFDVQTIARDSGGKEQVLVSVASLSAKARRAWKAKQRAEGYGELLDGQVSQEPWYIGIDLNYYVEQHKKQYYEAVQLVAQVAGLH